MASFPLKVLSYYGTRTVDRAPGAILMFNVEEDPENAWMQGITRFDVDEHRSWYEGGDLPSPVSADILVMGFWRATSTNPANRTTVQTC